MFVYMFARVCMTFNIFNGVPARIKNNAGSRLYIFLFTFYKTMLNTMLIPNIYAR